MRRRQLNKKRIGRFRSVPFGFVSFRSKAVARFKIGLRFSHFPTQLPSSLSSYVSYSYFSSFLSLQSLLYNPLTQSQLSRLYIPNHSSIQGFLFIEMSNSENREEQYGEDYSSLPRSQPGEKDQGGIRDDHRLATRTAGDQTANRRLSPDLSLAARNLRPPDFSRGIVEGDYCRQRHFGACFSSVFLILQIRIALLMYFFSFFFLL